MSAKPTPGPYRVIEDYGCFKVLAGNGLQWIHFYHGKSPSGKVVTADEAAANARAWVDGMAAMETLDRIRQLFVTCGYTPDTAHLAHQYAEAKP